MRALGVSFALGTCALLTSCITAHGWEYGTTPKAKELDLPACGPDALIDDGEDGDGRVLQREGRGGYWFTFQDSEGSTIDPPAGPFKMGAPGHGSTHAARMRGHMASSGKSIYAGMGLSLANPRGVYDASKYDGVTFWAKGPGKVRFEIPDVHTAPEGGECKDCYNDNGVIIALESEWHKYTIRFDWLLQRPNWGDPTPGLEAAQIIALEWEFSGAGRDYDISIDDIAFVCSGGKR
ncbi:MAG TPA: carbohydrate binding domain-containing protein [Polyangiaceae bacterium]|nr:carbohydrate binding domain-containing protein [Polyangiaceae bacterium]